MHILPMTSLVMSLQANPGVYALLLGSGVSRAASIPSGWDITLDLIHRLAQADREDTADNPEAWFRKKYGADPDYSQLLDKLYDPSARQAKLKEYVEPNALEREDGKKLPTKAHKAIARLVALGHLRVIVTTNFDHLLEDAIRAEGVVPTVISTPDAIDGAVPLVRTKCTVLKVHGDYLDTRIKNTQKELAEYHPKMNRLLDQILDSFGLIVCGWSAEWDVALRAAIERAPNGRYTIFWTGLHDPKDSARKLIDLREAKFIKIDSADAFFDDLAEKVAALQDASRPNPVDLEMAIAMAKRYIAEDRHRVRLNDLLLAEAKSDRQRLVGIERSGQPATQSFEEKVSIREAATERIRRILAACAPHATSDHAKLFRKCIEFLAADFYADQGSKSAHPFMLYPAVLAIYTTSLAALADSRDAVVAELLKARGTSLTEFARILPLFARSGFAGPPQPSGEGRKLAPVSEFLYAQSYTMLGDLYSGVQAFDAAYDRFEYVQALVAHDDKAMSLNYLIPGRWMWKAAWATQCGEPDVREVLRIEIDRDRENWPYLRWAFFNGSLQRLLEVKKSFDAENAGVVQRMRYGIT